MLTISIPNSLYPTEHLTKQIISGLMHRHCIARTQNPMLLDHLRLALEKYLFEPRDLQTYGAISDHFSRILRKWFPQELDYCSTTGTKDTDGDWGAIMVTARFTDNIGRRFIQTYTIQSDVWKPPPV